MTKTFELKNKKSIYNFLLWRQLNPTKKLKLIDKESKTMYNICVVAKSCYSYSCVLCSKKFFAEVKE